MEFFSSVNNVSFQSGFKWSINNFSEVNRSYTIRSEKVKFEEVGASWILEVSPSQCNTIETCIKLKCLIIDDGSDENAQYKFRIKFSNGSTLETPFAVRNKTAESAVLELNLQTMVTYEDPFILNGEVVFESISHVLKVKEGCGRMETPFSSLLNMREFTERESSAIELPSIRMTSSPTWQPEDRFANANDEDDNENAEVVDQAENIESAFHLDDDAVNYEDDENREASILDENIDDSKFYTKSDSDSNDDEESDEDENENDEEIPAKLESSYVRLTKRIKKIYLVKMRQIAETTSRFLVTSARVSST